MSREESSAAPSGAKAQAASPLAASTDPGATSVNKGEAYDDPPLDQMDPSDGESLEENEWRGQDPPEEYQSKGDIPEDEYTGADPEEYIAEEMPDDEMTASRSIASSIKHSGVRETMLDGPSYTSEGVDRYGVVESQDGFGDKETLGTQESKSNRDTKGSMTRKLKGRYEGHPGVRTALSPDATAGESVVAPSAHSPPHEPSVKSRSLGDAPSTYSPSNDPLVGSPGSAAAPSVNSPPHDPSVSSPASSAAPFGNAPPHDPSVNSPGFSAASSGYSKGLANGEASGPRSDDDGYVYEGEGEEVYSKDEYQSYDGSLQIDTQFSPRSDTRSEFTDGDELMSPLGSPTTQSFSSNTREAHAILAKKRQGKAHVLTGAGGSVGTPQAFLDAGDDSIVSPEPSPSVALSPHSETGSHTTTGSYTTGSYTTDASSIISAEANPSTRRALILQMAKARMNSGKRREENEKAEFGADEDSDEDTDFEPSAAAEKENDAVKSSASEQGESTRPLSPASDVNFEEEITGDLD